MKYHVFVLFHGHGVYSLIWNINFALIYFLVWLKITIILINWLIVWLNYVNDLLVLSNLSY